jgi:hypothetical protein
MIKYVYSADQDLSQKLKYEDADKWIEVKHTINLDPWKDVNFDSQKPINFGHARYEALCTMCGLDKDNKHPITLYTYTEEPGPISKNRVKFFKSKELPYEIGDVPHGVVIEFHKMDNSTSTTSGTAL